MVAAYRGLADHVQDAMHIQRRRSVNAGCVLKRGNGDAPPRSPEDGESLCSIPCCGAGGLDKRFISLCTRTSVIYHGINVLYCIEAIVCTVAH